MNMSDQRSALNPLPTSPTATSRFDDVSNLMNEGNEGPNAVHQDAVEELAALALSTVAELLDITSHSYNYPKAPESGKGILKRFGSRRDNRVSLLIPTYEQLSSVRILVEQLHWISLSMLSNELIQRSEIIQSLADISSLMRGCIQYVENPGEKNVGTSTSTSFSKRVHGWISSAQSTVDGHETLSSWRDHPADIPEPSDPEPPAKLLFTVHISPPSTGGEETSLLEDCFIRKYPSIRSPFYFSDFLVWATNINHSRAGAQSFILKSVHLCRGPTPLHHELTLLSFGSSTEVHSWIRVERAAWLNKTKTVTHPNSLTSFFGYVSLYEHVSFAKSKQALIGDSREIVSVNLQGQSDRPQISLHKVAGQLGSINQTYPSDQLFSEKCRWFSRRIVLNTIGLAETLKVRPRITFRGQLSSSGQLRNVLKQEPPDDAHLEDLVGLKIELDNQISKTTELVSSGHFEPALALSERSIKLLSALAVDATSGAALLRVLVTRSSALMTMGRFPEALQSSQQALNVAEYVPPITNMDTIALASAFAAAALFKLDRVHDGIKHMLDAVTLLRIPFEVGESGPLIPKGDKLRRSLADFLVTLSTFYMAVDDTQQALEAATEAIQHYRALCASDPGGRHEQPLASTLHVVYTALKIQHRDDAARDALNDAISAMRICCANVEDNPQMISQLASYLVSAVDGVDVESDVGRKEALGVLNEAIAMYRTLVNTGHVHFRETLAHALYSSGRILGESDDAVEEAIPVLRESVDILHSLMSEAGGSTLENSLDYRQPLAVCLGKLGDVHYKCGQLSLALACADEALDLFRSDSGVENAHFRDAFETTFKLSVVVLRKLGRGEEASNREKKHQDQTVQSLDGNNSSSVRRSSKSSRRPPAPPVTPSISPPPSSPVLSPSSTELIDKHDLVSSSGSIPMSHEEDKQHDLVQPGRNGRLRRTVTRAMTKVKILSRKSTKSSSTTRSA